MKKGKSEESEAEKAALNRGSNSASPFSRFSLLPTASLPSFFTAFKFWLWLGCVSFGGPAGQIALMHRELVERKKWIDDQHFLHALNFCMLLPGPEAQQLATYNGWRLHNAKGAAAAGAFFVLPSVLVLLVLSYLYAAFGNLPEIAAVLNSLKAVVLAVVVEAVFKIGKKALHDQWQWLVAAAAFVALYFFRPPFPIVVLVAAAIGAASVKFMHSGANVQTESPPSNLQNRENKTLLAPATSGVFFVRTAKTTLIFAALWLIPLLAATAFFGWRSLPIEIYLFFSGAAFVTFGGAYAVLAYVNQAAVESFGWITARQAIDGLALAETTPGPLIMVLQNVGFMAGWNRAPTGQNQTFFAVVCALLVTVATFLPSFLLVFLFAPFIERLHHNHALRRALSGVSAAVVGVILAVALNFGETVIFADQNVNLTTVLLAFVAFVLLIRFKINVLWLMLAGALTGLGCIWLAA